MKKFLNNKEKSLVVLSILVLVALIGTSFAYYRARVTKIRETETKIKTNELDLIYTGVGEIDYSSMIPGDSFVKTFTVENISHRSVSFNIYMQEILNELNEDLVYKIEETDSSGNVLTEIKAETALPTTNEGKSYLVQDIEIAKETTKYYKMTIEYKYTDTPQNDYQGKRFKAKVGIDSNAVDNLSATIDAEDVEYTNSYTDCQDAACAVDELYSEIAGA
ncbi:MAG: hypothetical protein E7158_05080 [Firmicutes bacterium]|nr:hypothetical protein [Bacillota bacterium]